MARPSPTARAQMIRSLTGRHVVFIDGERMECDGTECPECAEKGGAA